MRDDLHALSVIVLGDGRYRALCAIATRYSSVVKLQVTPGNVCTVPRVRTTRLLRSRAMPSKPTIPRVCERCGSPFLVEPHRAAKARFCSYDCSNPPRIERICEQCGLTFAVKAGHMKFHPALYCSPRCLGDSRRTGDPLEKASAARARNRAFAADVNARTICAHCGAQPIEWHNPDHVELNRQNYRISRIVGSARSIEAIKTEMARCTPLCRRCHMREDGRMKAFLAISRKKTKAV